jgi:Na+-transporting methylmalonyl-CoA/oxaloacetate decarboxylase gamma subunit
MNLKERLEFCRICQNRHVDFKTGLVCSLTNEKPEFEENCNHFLKDEKEAERVLKMKLDAAGNARSQNGSLNPKKNINYGIFLTIAGVLVFLFFSLLFGAIITFGGISFIIRGKQQEKVLAENQKLNEKINKDRS